MAAHATQGLIALGVWASFRGSSRGRAFPEGCAEANKFLIQVRWNR